MSSFTAYLRFALGFLLTMGVFLVPQAQQAPAFYPDVHAITSQKCAPCHQKKGAAPFPLLSYKDFVQRGQFVKEVTGARYMPPWPADPAHRHFENEIRLTDGEIELIAAWVEGGMEKGDAKMAADVSPTKAWPEPDTLLDIGQTYEVPGDGKDHFVYFLLPDTLKKDLYATAFRFFPGNKEVVHHLELLAAAPGLIPGTEGRQLAEGDYYGPEFRKTFSSGLDYIAGWLPGNGGEVYPQGVGKLLKQGSRLILMAHYAPSPIPTSDFTSLAMYCSPVPTSFEMESVDIHGEEDLVDGPLVLGAGQVRSFHGIKEVAADFQTFAIFPHAHHLCTSAEAYAVTPAEDTIPLLRIPKWDFDWQFTYYFPDYILLPAGTEVHFFATYDNSVDNPENPYHPPRDIYSSFKSNDEMMELFIWGITPKGRAIPPLNRH